MYVCLSVCLHVRSHISNTTRSKLTKLPVTVARYTFDRSAICYVLPVLWKTSCFHIMERIGIKNDACFDQFARSRGTVGERANAIVSDCILFEILIQFNHKRDQ